MLLAVMPASEFTEWVAYFELHPFGDDYRQQKEDGRMAILGTAIINTMRGLWAKKAKMLKVTDLMPKWNRGPVERDSKEQLITNREVLRGLYGSKKRKKP